MSTNDYGNKDKLNYTDLIFLEINRIANLATVSIEPPGIVSGRIVFSCKYLQPLIYHKLTKEDQHKFEEELKKVLSAGNSTIASNYFDLLLKYLQKTNLVPGRRTTYESGTGVD